MVLHLYPTGICLLKKLENKKKHRNIHKVIQNKKHEFLNEEAKVVENNDRLNILNQIFNQIPLIFNINSSTKFFKSGSHTTKDYIKNSHWK